MVWLGLAFRIEPRSLKKKEPRSLTKIEPRSFKNRTQKLFEYLQKLFELNRRSVLKKKRLGLVWLGLVWFGLAWLGLAWLGLVWLGLAFRREPRSLKKKYPDV